ncbi:MAG: hypothetical protein LBE21_04490 [Pseudomonadales bacterium]|jgi:hypothetical protein|nr:hypothetical protein [Pseudomonadales bacterium]
MQTLDQLLPQPLSTAERSVNFDGVREPVLAYRARAERDHIDAINQLFAEFELAYHNQFHKAYAQEGSLALAKKYWLGCLEEFPPRLILRAARHLAKTQEFLPTVAAVVAACENAPALFGLPPVRAAYIEACCKAEPKAQQAWSHPAVYLAGCATGWFALGSETQDAIFPLFEHNYQQLCQRVVRGETLEVPLPAALPRRVSAVLSAQENRARLAALRQRFDV